MGAAKAMAAGEWQKARELIVAIKIWELLPNPDQIKEMLTRYLANTSVCLNSSYLL